MSKARSVLRGRVVLMAIAWHGYWVYLPPLPRGTTHLLQFGATFTGDPTNPVYRLDVTDHITVE